MIWPTLAFAASMTRGAVSTNVEIFTELDAKFSTPALT
jgi:hypothetical protein